MSDAAPAPLRVRSVVELAYDELRARIVDGRLPPGARVGQGELADALGISRAGREPPEIGRASCRERV